MDIFRRKKFDEAMFAKNRTLAIRVGQYQSSKIKEAHFDYGYIKGDTCLLYTSPSPRDCS